MSTIRVGSVGVGEISGYVHLPGIKESSDFELAAICDIDEKTLNSVKQSYNLPENKCYKDYRELIADSEIDAIDIATPNDSHFDVALEAVRAGKPYCVEKPVTLNAEQAKQLAKESADKNIANMVCFSYRFVAAARMAKQMIADGKLGEIYHVDVEYDQCWAMDDWGLIWRFVKAESGSGTLADLGCHILDLTRFITGQEFTRVIGQAGTFVKERKLLNKEAMGAVDVDDYVNVLANLSGGGSATIRSTRFAWGRGNHQRMEVNGSKGSLIYQMDKDTLKVCFMDDPKKEAKFETLEVSDEYKGNQMQSFADILCGKGDGLAATIEDGLINQITIDAILKSVETGEWIDL